MVCRQTDRTSVPLAGITRRSCICTNPRKVRSRCARREAFEKPISVYRPTCAWPHGTCVAVLSCLQWGRRPLSPRLWKDPFARSDSPFPPGGCGWVGQGACARLGPEAPAAAAVFLRDCCLPLRAATGAARWSRPERRPVPGSVAAGAPGLQPARWGAGLPRGCGVGRVCNVSLSSSEQRRVLLSAEWAGPCRESRSTEQLFRIGSNTVANLLSGLGRVFRRCLSFNLLSPL